MELNADHLARSTELLEKLDALAMESGINLHGTAQFMVVHDLNGEGAPVQVRYLEDEQYHVLMSPSVLP